MSEEYRNTSHDLVRLLPEGSDLERFRQPIAANRFLEEGLLSLPLYYFLKAEFDQVFQSLEAIRKVVVLEQTPEQTRQILVEQMRQTWTTFLDQYQERRRILEGSIVNQSTVLEALIALLRSEMETQESHGDESIFLRTILERQHFSAVVKKWREKLENHFLRMIITRYHPSARIIEHYRGHRNEQHLILRNVEVCFYDVKAKEEGAAREEILAAFPEEIRKQISFIDGNGRVQEGEYKGTMIVGRQDMAL